VQCGDGVSPKMKTVVKLEDLDSRPRAPFRRVDVDRKHLLAEVLIWPRGYRPVNPVPEVG
jgi:hypothetical protein